MSINVKFLTALSNIDKLRAQTVGREAALDAVIMSRPHVKELTGAVRAHRAFWNLVEPHLVANTATLEKKGLAQIRQKAAEQRVVLGLNNANIEVLVAILTHNGDACREYIASQKMLPLEITVADKSADGVAKKDNKKSWDNVTGVLTNDVLVAIKGAAVQQLLVLAEQKLDQIDNSEHLVELKELVDVNDIDGLIHMFFNINFTATLPNIKIPAPFKEALEKKTTAVVRALSTNEINETVHLEIFDTAAPSTQVDIAAISTDPAQPLIENVLSSDEYEDSQDVDKTINAEILVENSALNASSAIGVDDYKKIHNAALAQFIADNTALALKTDGVVLINKVLHAMPDFSSPAGFKQFIDAISPAFTHNVGQQLYPLLGLSADGQSLADNPVRDAIRQQHQFNIGIMDVNKKYNKEASNVRYTELFNLFLSVEKNKSLAANHRSFSELERYFSLINKASGRADFLRKCPDTSNDEQQLKKALASRLTDDLFNRLQKEIRSAVLLKSHDTARDSLKGIDKELKQLAKSYEPIIKQSSALDYLANLEPEQLAGPTFQAKASVDAEALRAKYAALAAQCNLVCEQLKRDYHQLNVYLNNLPSETQLNGIHPLDKALGDDNLNKIKTYETSLPGEMTKIKTALEQYQKLQQKATDIIKVIDHAAEGGVYRKVRDGVTCRAVPHAQITDLPHQVNDTSTPIVAGQMNSQPARENWQLLKTSEHESAFIFDTEHNCSDKQVQIRGRFIQTYPQDVLAAPISIQEGEKKPPVCRIEAKEVPTFTKPLQGGDKAELDRARVKFFMEMAAALLAANHGKAPTKDNPIRLYGSDPNQIKFLWTALVLLGEGKPAFGKEAISVHASSFDLKEEEGRFFGYSNSSLYNTVFKKYKGDVERVQNHSQQALADDGHDKATKVMEQFKSGLERAKFDSKAVDKLVAEEGPAPEPRGMHK